MIPVYTIDGFKAARFVVKSRVDYARIIASLMLGHLVFFFNNQEFERWILLLKSVSRGQAHNAPANDYDVVLHKKMMNNICHKITVFCLTKQF